MNLHIISLLVAALVQGGQVKPNYGWSATSYVPLKVAIAWDGQTGLPKEWDKKLFPTAPICTHDQALAAMNRVPCDPQTEGGGCYQRRTDAALAACGAVMPAVVSIIYSGPVDGKYLFCRKMVSAPGRPVRRYGCKLCRLSNGKTASCRKISGRQAKRIHDRSTTR